MRQAPSRQSLNLPLQNEVVSYLNVAYPLIFLLAEPRLRGWYLERFVHIFSQIWFGNYLRTDYTDSSRYFGDLLERQAVSMEEARAFPGEGGPIALIRQAIADGRAVNVFALDKYYLPESAEYRTEHAIHETLVDGYDEAERKLFVIGYGRNGRFARLSYDYGDFERAFEAAVAASPAHLTDALHLIKPRSLRREYPFEPGRFAGELRKLVFSERDDAKLFFSLADEGEARFGFDVYEHILTQMRLRIDGCPAAIVNFTAIHFIAEHSKLLGDRFSYLQERYRPGVALSSLLDRYSGTTGRYEKLKYHYLKRATAESGFRDRFAVRDPDAFESVYRMLKEIVEGEKELLTETVGALEREFG
ncbi:hypothetical protein [Cohnella zeiphila]|uniref:Butirosin biosynthesis protein H N-terminal domain-containing protein n=1 Tax=Cohnella zeiphila TaxID=2761120 RepID=A0A7X0SHA3_9BACL|nr:hypothetical protein [Cohnella zeiphila]MBB6729979.1 hypothetical protein [Cohnella zeiphila]